MNLKRFFILAFSSLLALSAFHFHKQHHEKEQLEEVEELETPNDYFFFQRSYPEQVFAQNAYLKALQAAKSAAAERSDPLNANNINWKIQGPGNLGARVNVVKAHPSNPNIIYVGFSGGGIFKTTDGGGNWFPIFDEQAYLSVSDIVLDPQNPEIVYVGTGDVNISGYPFIGNGVFRSNNGGQNWTNLGLSDQKIISKITIDPSNSNILYAACMGNPFVRDNKRGVYKSINKGATWSQVLFISTQTGVVDLLQDPNQPNTLYAAGWDRIRNNAESVLSGTGAKIYKTTDGGSNWTVLGGGLPTDAQSRIGLAMSKQTPNTIFAEYVGVNLQLNGIYKTTDGGNNFSTIPTSSVLNGLSGDALGGMGWYFGKIWVNPTNDNDIMVAGVDLWRTQNGGNNWSIEASSTVETDIHADKHALDFLPNGNILLGTDGGLYLHNVANNSWQDVENIPTTQFYRVAYNPHNPNMYYGGAQDNGTSRGSSSEPNNWNRIYGADGFQPAFHSIIPEKFYVETQNGNIAVTTDNGASWNSATNGLLSSDRRNWDMPYLISTHNPDKMYCGTYRLYKSVSANTPNWVSKSADLTDGVLTEDRFHNITTIAESPIDSNQLLVGTSDANVWRTDNGGATWTNITAGLPNRYITSVKSSQTNSNSVFVAQSGYRDNDVTPHIFKSDNKGGVWKSISGDLPNLAVNDLLVLPNSKDSVIFAATDGGVYATSNAGVNWQRLGKNMPFIPVYDIDLNVAKNEIIAGTFARSIMTFPIDSLNINVAVAKINLSGLTYKQNGIGVENVTIALDPQSNIINTDASGIYNFFGLNKGISTTITPYKNTEIVNGVTTFDMVLARKHILGVELLASPYQQIAADVNKSGTITTFDLVEMRKVILRIQDTFPNNTSWRFVPVSYIFVDPSNAFLDFFPESITKNTLAANTVNENFIAIKIGDVNDSALGMGNFGNDPTERSSETLQLFYPEFEYTAGEIISLPVQGKSGTQDVQGFQFSLKFDAQRFDYLGLDKENTVINDFSEENIGVSYAKQGILTFSWDGLVPSSTRGDWFKLKFRAKKSGNTRQNWSLNSDFTQAEGYDSVAKKMSITLTSQSKSSVSDWSFTANPFQTQTTLQLNLTTSATLEVELFTLDGKKCFAENRNFAAGFQEINISDSRIPKGILLYQIFENGKKIGVGKLLKM